MGVRLTMAFERYLAGMYPIPGQREQAIAAVNAELHAAIRYLADVDSYSGLSRRREIEDHLVYLKGEINMLERTAVPRVPRTPSVEPLQHYEGYLVEYRQLMATPDERLTHYSQAEFLDLLERELRHAQRKKGELLRERDRVTDNARWILVDSQRISIDLHIQRVEMQLAYFHQGRPNKVVCQAGHKTPKPPHVHEFIGRPSACACGAKPEIAMTINHDSTTTTNEENSMKFSISTVEVLGGTVGQLRGSAIEGGKTKVLWQSEPFNDDEGYSDRRDESAPGAHSGAYKATQAAQDKADTILAKLFK